MTGDGEGFYNAWSNTIRHLARDRAKISDKYSYFYFPRSKSRKSAQNVKFFVAGSELTGFAPTERKLSHSRHFSQNPAVRAGNIREFTGIFSSQNGSIS